MTRRELLLLEVSVPPLTGAPTAAPLEAPWRPQETVNCRGRGKGGVIRRFMVDHQFGHHTRGLSHRIALPPPRKEDKTEAARRDTALGARGPVEAEVATRVYLYSPGRPCRVHIPRPARPLYPSLRAF
ncbi:hypothetical protein F5X68DRAFT_19310 [Plectosphaerella plurivora]|uniref:Uncharacterized protein n=1 Tax=Plectosphaerella plurivora TaxID=936078 RepID=A0A9P8VA38_9PEZI|nr:hypothetical protein F5X68DRAFT_19310 [Plectosphaerella plurivora]